MAGQTTTPGTVRNSKHLFNEAGHPGELDATPKPKHQQDKRQTLNPRITRMARINPRSTAFIRVIGAIRGQRGLKRTSSDLFATVR
jgi:hypothetical protein